MTLYELEKCLRLCIEVDSARELVDNIIEFIKNEHPRAVDIAVSFKDTLMKLTVKDIMRIASKTNNTVIFEALINLWLTNK